MLTGDNGLITKAQQSKEEQKLAEELENLKLELQNAQVEVISQNQKVNFYNVGTILENKGYVCEYTSSPLASLDETIYQNYSYMQVTKNNYTFVVDTNMKIVYTPVTSGSSTNPASNSGLQNSTVITKVNIAGTASSNTQISMIFG